MPFDINHLPEFRAEHWKCGSTTLVHGRFYFSSPKQWSGFISQKSTLRQGLFQTVSPIIFIRACSQVSMLKIAAWVQYVCLCPNEFADIHEGNIHKKINNRYTCQSSLSKSLPVSSFFWKAEAVLIANVRKLLLHQQCLCFLRWACACKGQRKRLESLCEVNRYYTNVYPQHRLLLGLVQWLLMSKGEGNIVTHLFFV